MAAAGALGALSVFWQRGAEVVAGVGVVAEQVAVGAGEVGALVDRVTATGTHWTGEERLPGAWFGGVAFDPRRGGWPGFPASRWVVPAVAIWKRGDRCYLTEFHSRFPAERGRELGGSVRRERACSTHAWRRLTAVALRAIAAGKLQKVVLARSIDLRPPRRIDPAAVLSRLRARFPACTVFLLRGGGGRVFLGATPETLFRLVGRRLATEALAGSAPPERAAWLLGSEKDRREHQLVVDGIRQALAPLCEQVTMAAAPAILPLANAVHLRTPIRGRLRRGVTVGAVLAALHPTPAVGGTPRREALRFLAAHEGLDRGWYAGPVGWLGEGRADLSVAIRSALIDGGVARLFVGAGVVGGSTAEAEWRETEVKSAAMRDAVSPEGRHVAG